MDNMDNVAMNMGYTYLYIGEWSFIYVPRSDIAGSYISSIFNILVFAKLTITMTILIYTPPHIPTVNDGSFHIFLNIWCQVS